MSHACGLDHTQDQIFHKDTQRAPITGHRTRAVMVMYYPGAARAAGEAGILPALPLRPY